MKPTLTVINPLQTQSKAPKTKSVSETESDVKPSAPPLYLASKEVIQDVFKSGLITKDQFDATIKAHNENKANQTILAVV